MCATSQSPESPPHACLWYQDYQRMCGGGKYMHTNCRFLLVYIHTCHKLFLNMPIDHMSIPPAYHKNTIKETQPIFYSRALCKNCRFLLVYIHTCHKLFLNMPIDHMSILPAYHKNTVKKTQRILSSQALCKNCRFLLVYIYTACTCHKHFFNMPIDHMSIPPAYHKNTINKTQLILCSQGITLSQGSQLLWLSW